MSLIPASTLLDPGQIVEPSGGTALQGGASAFGKIQELTGVANQPAQLVSQQVSATPAALVLPAPASFPDVLKPKLEYAGNSLSLLNARVATIKPSSAADSLQNRLDLLNVQFRVLGNNLQDSAARNDPMQLLRLQNDIYQMDEELELVSKVVDQATNGVRSLLQTQV